MAEEKLTDQEQVRRQKVEKLKELGLDPFGQKYDQTDWSKDIQDKVQAKLKELGVNVISYTPYSFGARNQSYQVCLGLIKYADRYVQIDSDDSFTNTIISRVQDSSSKRTDKYDAQEEL